MRYKVNRIGFVNFWLYDCEDFYFYDGKLLLRGTNGSGKTVTMQSFFPLIFDGNRSPERLDPFGSRDRKIEDYLLSEGVNENTGYLYIEFYNKEENKYLTIGIGLKAIRNRPTDFWGFSITDNRRIGDDFILFKERNLRIPLTKKELQTRIGVGGDFVDSQKEYKKMVNRLLFGFPNIDLYTEFINLLIQVRSPKLSNSTRPHELTKILSTVLEPLSENDLRTMADSMEDMNKYKEKIGDLEIEKRACDNLKSTFSDYNKVILYNKGEEFLKNKLVLKNIQNDISEIVKEQETLSKLVDEERVNKTNLELEKQELEHRKSILEDTDLKVITKELDEIIENINSLEDEKKYKSIELDNKESIRIKIETDLKAREDELFNLEKDFDDLLKELSSYEDDINFDDAKFYLDDLKEKKYDFKDINSFFKTLKKRLELLSTLKDISYRIKTESEKVDVIKEQYKIEDNNLKEQQKLREDISRKLLEAMDLLRENIAHVSLDNKILNLSDDSLNSIYSIIDSFDRNIFNNIKDVIIKEVYRYKDSINLDISNSKIRINEYESKINSLKDELNDIDNVLIKNVDDNETREYLDNNNISYKYFFELIDFKDISDSDKKMVESFLYDTGIITAIVTNGDIDGVKFKTLEPTSKKSNNLSKYLVSVDYRNKVDRILESISLDSGCDEYIDGNNYRLSVISGRTSNNHELRYIGEDVRNKFISNMKEKINVNIKQLEHEIINLRNDILRFENDIVLVDEEFNNFIFNKEIIGYFDDLDKIDFRCSMINDVLDKLLIDIKDKNSSLHILEDELKSSSHGYYGELDYDSIVCVLDSTNSYFEVLKLIEKPFNDHFMTLELINNYKDSLENIYSDLDNIKYEFDKIVFKLNDFNNRKNNLNDILNSDKYKNVGVEYSKIKERLLVIDKERDAKQEIITSSLTRLEVSREKELELKSSLNESKLLMDVTYKIFMDEYNLGYVSCSEITDIYKFVKSIKINTNIIDALNKFNESISKYLPQLIGYAPKYINRHQPLENEYLNFTSNSSKAEVIMDLLNGAKRMDLNFTQGGKVMNLLELSNFIDMEITSYESLLSEENAKLFKDTLINNIGSSIRSKIQSSEEWINEVRELMESMNTTSGLSFSLKWVGNEALTEEEIDTKEIVNIFMKDAEMLNDSHIDKISKHFQSKIKMREDALEESERNYLEIIKDVLDYRQWFQFKLYFKRGNGDKKELTDREFNKMSGGEKAIAMYIPLFSSIFAKLNSAYKYAPHVIALDEAFAGVDDENINDAFRILDKLDIDYVLTSQQLWGDYESIKHLAISELYHPINSKVVSIINYKWDGKSREKVADVSEYLL